MSFGTYFLLLPLCLLEALVKDTVDSELWDPSVSVMATIIDRILSYSKSFFDHTIPNWQLETNIPILRPNFSRTVRPAHD